MIWQPLIGLIRRHSDTDRPLRLAQVLDTSQWSATGASFVQVLVADAARLAIYRDGPRPAIGSYLQVVQTGPDTASPYLALPLPQPLPMATCAGFAYASAQDVTGTHGGEWAILRYDLLTTTWTRRSASPVVGTYARRPLRHSGDGRLWTWGVAGTEAAPGAGSAAYYSDDGGATWTDCGLAGVRFVSRNDTASFAHTLYAITGDGAGIAASADNGTTWEARAGGPLGGGAWLAVNPSMQGNQQAFALATTGGYTTAAEFRPDWFEVGDPGMYGPYGPGADGYGALALSGDWQQLAYGDGVVRGETTAWAQTTAPATLPADAGAAVPGGPGASGGAGFVATRGTGGAVALATAVGDGSPYGRINSATVIYDATNHPTGRDVGARGATRVYYTDAEGGTAWCWFVATDDAAPGTPKFATSDQHAKTATPWPDATTRMLADLGAVYVASPDGVAAYDTPDTGSTPPPTSPYSVYSVPGGTRSPGSGNDLAITTTAGAGWEAVGYDDTAWDATVGMPGDSPIPRAQQIGPGTPDAPVYVRRTFTPPSGATTCTLKLWTEGGGLSAYLNGIALGSTGSDTIWTLDASALLLPGAANVLALVAAGPPVDYVGFGTSLGVGVAFAIVGQ